MSHRGRRWGDLRPHRRRALQLAAAATASAWRAAVAAPANDRPALRLFSKPLQWLDVDALAAAAAAAGYAGLDLTVRPGGHVEPERVATDLPAAVAAARRHGLAVDMIVTAITSADDPLARRVLEVAAGAGVTVYRMGYLGYDDTLGTKASLAALRGRMAALADVNRGLKITGCYQNHHGHGAEGNRLGAAIWDIDALLEGVDPAWLGCQYDLRHAVADGTGSWERTLRLIAPRIRSLCLKDFRWKEAASLAPEDVPAGRGVVPWDNALGLLHSLGVRVPATVHCEWPLFAPEERSLPEADRRRLAIERVGADREFFAAAIARAGLAIQPPVR